MPRGPLAGRAVIRDVSYSTATVLGTLNSFTPEHEHFTDIFFPYSCPSNEPILKQSMHLTTFYIKTVILTGLVTTTTLEIARNLYIQYIWGKWSF